MTRPRLHPAGWGMVRAPLLPVDFYESLGVRLDALDDEHFDRVLRDVVVDPRIRAALMVASSTAAAALAGTDRIERDSRLTRTLHHYLVRMSSRPTPYGLFAGVGMIEWGAGTDLAIGADPVTSTRPDMELLTSLVSQLEADPKVRQHLSYTRNPSAFERGGRFRITADGSSVRAGRVVAQALHLARRPITHAELVAVLGEQPGATPEKAERLVSQLWERRLLVTDLRVPLTTADPAQYLLDRLAGIDSAAPIAASLRKLTDAMRAWDSGDFGTAPRHAGDCSPSVGS